MPNPFEHRFVRMQTNFNAARTNVMSLAGAIIVEHSDQAFIQGGWTDQSFAPWDKRASDKAKDEGRAILVKTGHLRGSIRVISATPNSVTVGTNMPYARIHNEGGTINHPPRGGILNFDRTPAHGIWRFGKASTEKQQRGIKAIRRVTYKAYTQTIKKRHFLGNSQQQTKKIREMFINTIKISLTK